jgi:hypothetical protein
VWGRQASETPICQRRDKTHVPHTHTLTDTHTFSQACPRLVHARAGVELSPIWICISSAQVPLSFLFDLRSSDSSLFSATARFHHNGPSQQLRLMTVARVVRDARACSSTVTDAYKLTYASALLRNLAQVYHSDTSCRTVRVNLPCHNTALKVGASKPSAGPDLVSTLRNDLLPSLLPWTYYTSFKQQCHLLNTATRSTLHG